MAQTEEFRTAKALERGVGSLTFDPMAFAFVLADAEPIIQVRAMQALLAFVEVMASKIEYDSLSEPNADAIVLARRIADVLETYNA